jgi:outer membrane receptor for ferrienterochelin and colicin
MRQGLLTLLFLCSVFSLFGQEGQVDMQKKLDFHARNLTMGKALEKLSKRSKISIAYSENLISQNQRITIRFKKKSFKHILEYLLRNTGLDYKVIGDQIVLFKVSSRSFTLSGYVKDGTSGERLIACHVFDNGAIRGTTTNEYGFYSLTLKEGIVRVRFSYLGFETETKVIKLNKNKRLDVELDPLLFLQEILVLDNDSTQMHTFSLEHISPQLINTLPSLGGEPDVFRVAQLMPGVQTGADGVGGIHVRGGGADQNLYLLDGVPIYNPSHLAGIFSIYDTDAIRSTQLMKDFIPAKFGGRLSSVLDVRTKEGNSKKWEGTAGIGLTSFKAGIEGPIKKNKGAVFISGRRALLDFVVKPITKKLKEDRNEEGFSDYGFYDLNAKLNYTLSAKDQVYFSMYTGMDRFYDENQTRIEDEVSLFSIESKEERNLSWGNNVGALRWNHLFNAKLFLNTTFTYSDYHFSSKSLEESLEIKTDLNQQTDTLKKVAYSIYQSRIQDWALKTDFDFVAGPNHYWRFGFEGISHLFNPGVRRTEDPEDFPGFENETSDTFNISTIAAQEYSLYIEDQWTLSGKWKANIGLRTTAFTNDEQRSWRLSPRAQLWYELLPKVRLKSSFNLLHQHLHLLTTSTIGLPNDLWVPATKRIKPQRSWQGMIGMETERKKGLKFSMDLYYKKMDELVAFQEGADFTILDARNWEDKVTIGEGESYGAEFYVHKKIKKWTIWLTYSWSKTNRQFEEINLGRQFPYRYDRRHNGQVNVLYQWNKRWRVAANWNYGTGLATTLANGKYEFPLSSGTIPVAISYGDKNSVRMPAYHRLDIDLGCRIQKGWALHQFNIGIYNTYSRKNPVYYRIGRDPDDLNKNRYIQATLFQILPYFSYRISI